MLLVFYFVLIQKCNFIVLIFHALMDNDIMLSLKNKS
ncbi:unnamed protein product [Staphylococcus haemolyticus JCSC1435]|uniref:Uncharacterized protein n=1 Tax=Staphylococcus haemolyticus (strain JCSC1435) TaxID=279808 RepID=Q4L6Z0_STAHJ|nr:unnamed protein product [Staphylococcus haemolyticus JCSC1435]